MLDKALLPLAILLVLMLGLILLVWEFVVALCEHLTTKAVNYGVQKQSRQKL